ncbi:MAG TPA: hypothetical protein ENJ10_00180 [Caldithrix abyssi]|uniref:Uncharacterized protein n=1 Tax=Caldithrix abyssi TaxID=187145 RepID=A0A7V1LJI5_CALAY|nr:hypothetical protein [Caldithrix abyssi]
MKGLFVFFIGLMLSVGMFYEAVKYLKEEQQRAFEEIAAHDSTFTLERPLSEADSLRLMLEKYQQEIALRDQKMDSLNNITKNSELAAQRAKAMAEKLALEKQAAIDKEEQAKVMAKTFSKMKVNQIAPILKNLDDSTILLIYRHTGNRFKKNILLAINEKRAAALTKNFITQR